MFTSKTIQNKILSSLAEMVAGEIKHVVRECTVFSHYRRTEDVSKLDQISFIRTIMYIRVSWGFKKHTDWTLLCLGTWGGLQTLLANSMMAHL